MELQPHQQRVIEELAATVKERNAFQDQCIRRKRELSEANRACEWSMVAAGTPEGLKLLAESKRYGAAFDVIMALRQQLAAALAACEAKDVALSPFCDGDIPDDDEPEGYYRKAKEALAIKPDASALKTHDEALIERCAKVAEEMIGPMCQPGLDIATAIRKLKESL